MATEKLAHGVRGFSAELTKWQCAKCDGDDGTYAKAHYALCCGKGRFVHRREICKRAAPVTEDDERTPSYPQLLQRILGSVIEHLLDHRCWCYVRIYWSNRTKSGHNDAHPFWCRENIM